MKKTIASLSVITSLFLIGCGNGSSVTDANINYDQANIFAAPSVNVNYSDYTVKVVDDAIVNAQVSAPECNSSKEIGNGVYVLLNCTSKPTYISVNSGVIDETNATQSFPLVLNVAQTNKDDNFVVTPLTTLVATASDEDEIEEVAEKLGLDVEEIFEDPVKVDKNVTPVLQKVNAIYLKAEADGAIANKVKFIDTVREQIKTYAKNGDFNVTKVASEVEKISQQKPQLFGLVFVSDIKDTKDILEEIAKVQNPNKVRFLGLVFDDKLANMNIKIYRADTNETIDDNITSDSNGKWEFTLSDEWVQKIKNEDFVIIMEASDDKNITLTSSITSKKLRNLLKESKNVTPSKNPELVISNVTTAEDAILNKKGAMQSVVTYEGNKTELKTYYNDKVITTAAVIKDVIDNNNTSILDNTDAKDTYELVDKIVTTDDGIDVNLTKTEVNTATISEIEENMTDNAILSRQINYVPVATTINVDGFEAAAKRAGNVFYRILAYYNENGDFVREYTKIVTLPGLYQTQTCYLYNDETQEWHCDDKKDYTKANFSNGKFNASLSNSEVISYSLDFNTSLFVPQLCKSYNIYDVAIQDIVANDVISTTPEVLVDSFDIVDMFRRMPKEDNESFEDLKERVKGKARDEVNYELNRFVRENLEDVKEYFSDEDTTECQQ